MITKKLMVHTIENSYPIYIGKSLINKNTIFNKHLTGNKFMLVTSDNIPCNYAQSVAAACQPSHVDTLVLPDGEAHKTFDSWKRIIDSLLKNKHHRDTTLIAVGGGVIGDVVGFAAACYQRGVHFIQVPTSLLAQVDASIGGKTAINHPIGKNMIGAFHQPQAVIIDIDTLQTLPTREFSTGMAEIIKAALLTDADFFSMLEKNAADIISGDHNLLVEVIYHACRIKRDIVVQDEKELSGQRALLNLGHTFGHALENISGYGKWLHGEAVAIGVVLAAKLSQLKYGFSETQRIIDLLKHYNLPYALPRDINLNHFISAMQYDKKVFNNQLRFILLQRVGHAVICDNVSPSELEAVCKS